MSILLAAPGLVRGQTPPATAPSPGSQATQTLARIAADIFDCLDHSRAIMLGSRDPYGPSCVNSVLSGEIIDQRPADMGDLDGGPGSRMVLLYTFDRQHIDNPEEDLLWHQTRLRSHLQNQLLLNRDAWHRSSGLFARAKALSDQINQWTSLPADFAPVTFSNHDTLPSYCLTMLNAAVASGRLEGAQRWAAELASASFALEDLHRWLAFSIENQLSALDFQKQSKSLFVSATPLLRGKYAPNSTISQFPAGLLSMLGLSNLLEIERQAERIFSMQTDQTAEIAPRRFYTSGSVWVSPGVRESFLQLQQVLSPANQKTWEIAARAPYEHSYMVNMLHRASRSGSIPMLAGALRQFDQANPEASVSEMMDVLMYRGNAFGGLEWPDRYQPLLMPPQDAHPQSSLEKFLAAHERTNQFFRSPVQYGPTFTLRQAIESRRMDCLRATDMLGAIHRNSGGSRFGFVRWCSEEYGHSVAAYLGEENAQPRVVLADGMVPEITPEVWPDAYFNGHAWPEPIPTRLGPYAVELYVRGLDNYVWAEGYIIRGPNAGTLTKAAVPYLPGHNTTDSRKIFNGPYPR